MNLCRCLMNQCTPNDIFIMFSASSRELVAESDAEAVTYVPPNHLHHPLASMEKGICLLPRVQTGSSSITLSTKSGPQSRAALSPPNQTRDSDSSWASRLPAQASVSPTTPILHPTTGLPKGYTPIPTLLAKSVGNKVTLMKRPADYPGFNNTERRSKRSLVSTPTSALTTTKLSKAQSSPSSSQQNAHGQTEIQRQAGTATVTAALPKSLLAKPCQTVPKSPVQKVMQQVVILPPNLFIHKTEDSASSLHQQQTKGIYVPVSKVASPLCMSTNVPGFTIPENRIPVQQVAPLKNARAARTPSPSVSPCLQQEVLKTAGLKETQVCAPQASDTQGVMPNLPPITNASRAVSTEPTESPNAKQELKTVCIRDSQSILVTTRGGNTGIVKVQTSSDQNALGSLSANPVITISPQFKAFLVSKASQTPSPSAASQSSCSTPAAQTQKLVSSVLKSPSAVTTPMLPAATGSFPVTSPGNQTANTPPALGSNNSAGSTVATKIAQHVQTVPSGAHFQASLVKNTVVPSLSSSGVPQVLTQADVISKRGVKRASTNEKSQLTKFILVTPSSSSASNVALSKDTSSASRALPNSGVMFISQPSAASSTASVGSIPKQPVATGASGRLLTSTISSQTVKVGVGPGQPVGSVNSETLSKVQNITLPSGG